MTTDDQPPRIGPFRKIRQWVIASHADWSSEDTPVPPRPAGLDTRLPAAMAAELKAADPEGREALQILFKVGESINEEFRAIDPHWEHPEVLPRPRRIYHAVNGLEMDVNNGGFQQYYINSWSDCAHELPDMLRDIGLPELADLVARANAIFPKGPPANRSVRLAAIDQLGDAADEWNEMDSEFFTRKTTRANPTSSIMFSRMNSTSLRRDRSAASPSNRVRKREAVSARPPILPPQNGASRDERSPARPGHCS